MDAKQFFCALYARKNRIDHFWVKKPKIFSHVKKPIIFSNLYMFEGDSKLA